MIGICSYGGYLPRYRLNRMQVFKTMGWLNPAVIAYARGEKAVANHDEDSITMAVTAAMDALTGVEGGSADGLYFASTTMPYAETQNAGLVKTAMGLPHAMRTVDVTGTPKAGVTAIMTALDAVMCGSHNKAVVVSADTRLGKPASAQEMIFGDGAAALVMGKDGVIAEYLGAYSRTSHFPDHWRTREDRWDHQWEDRFIRDEGYGVFIPEAFKGLLQKCGLAASDIHKVIYPCLYPADFMKIAKTCGLTPNQIEAPLMESAGYLGAADAPAHLVKALETASPGDNIVVIGYGSGAEALLFRVTENITAQKGLHMGMIGSLERKKPLPSYEKMLVWTGQLPVEKGIRGEAMAFTALSDLWRNSDTILALKGVRCKACKTPQYPAQRVCAMPGCGAVDEMEPYAFADKTGRLFTYTADSLAFSLNPPAIYGMVDFDGGGRFWFDITDADADELTVDMPVGMQFRKKYTDTTFGINGYFWKAVPIGSYTENETKEA